MTTKICSKCCQKQDLDLFYKRRSAKDGLQNRCKACQDEDRNARAKTEDWKICLKKWKAANPEKVKASAKKWQILNPEKADKWRKNNPDKFQSYQNEYRKQQCKELTDSYIRRLIYKQTKTFESPALLIQTVRAHIQIKRFLKEN